MTTLVLLPQKSIYLALLLNTFANSILDGKTSDNHQQGLKYITVIS
jgi:hypothetical protein